MKASQKPRIYKVWDSKDFDRNMVLVVAENGRKAKTLGFHAIGSFVDVPANELLLNLRVRVQRDKIGVPVVPALPEGVYDGFDLRDWMKLGFAGYDDDGRVCAAQDIADGAVYRIADEWRYDPDSAEKQLAAMKGRSSDECF